MNRNFIIGLLAATVLAVPSFAQSPFDGTWKGDPKSFQMPTKPDTYLLQNGVYECQTCVPPVKIPADGAMHKISGNPYIDMMSIRVLDPRTIAETDRRNGKIVATSKTYIAPNGNIGTVSFVDATDSSHAPVTGKAFIKRVAAGPAGSHAISGSWITSSVASYSANGMTVTYKVSGDRITMSNPTGQSYAAMLDGTDAPYRGDPGVTTVSVRRLAPDTIEETDKRDGKIVGVATMKVAAGGGSMAMTYVDKQAGKTYAWTVTKQ